MNFHAAFTFNFDHLHAIMNDVKNENKRSCEQKLIQFNIN